MPPDEEELAVGSEWAVLIVDDNSDLVDLFAAWLRDLCSIRTAYDGEQALDSLDSDVDVVILDRRMPGLTGDQVLEAIRADGLDCYVIMSTAVTPQSDIAGMEFDEYLVKPVTREDLIKAVERVQLRDAYDELIREYFALLSKRAALEAHLPVDDLQEEREYTDLRERIDELARTLEGRLDEIDYDRLLREGAWDAFRR